MSGTSAQQDGEPSRYGSIRTYLRRKAPQIVGDLIEPGALCALVDFPTLGNVGDSAIWLGERVLPSQLGALIVYTCDQATFSQEMLIDRLLTGTIFIHGGRNLGDLWPAHQRFRKRIIQAFPQHRIVQLPQSIYVRSRTNLDRARAVFDIHPDLTLCVRDTASLQLARSCFRARSLLCPDMAFAVEELPPPARPMYDIVWLARDDHESSMQQLPLPTSNILITDWTTDEGASSGWKEQIKTAVQAYEVAVGEFTTRGGYESDLTRVVLDACDKRAALQLARGCTLLSSGQVVITDRLHGHVLSQLLNIPHVVIGDRNGKIHNLWDTWAIGTSSASRANSPLEALIGPLSSQPRRRLRFANHMDAMNLNRDSNGHAAEGQ